MKRAPFSITLPTNYRSLNCTDQPELLSTLQLWIVHWTGSRYFPRNALLSSARFVFCIGGDYDRSQQERDHSSCFKLFRNKFPTGLAALCVSVGVKTVINVKNGGGFSVRPAARRWIITWALCTDNGLLQRPRHTFLMPRQSLCLVCPEGWDRGPKWRKICRSLPCNWGKRRQDARIIRFTLWKMVGRNKGNGWRCLTYRNCFESVFGGPVCGAVVIIWLFNVTWNLVPEHCCGKWIDIKEKRRCKVDGDERGCTVDGVEREIKNEPLLYFMFHACMISFEGPVSRVYDQFWGSRFEKYGWHTAVAIHVKIIRSLIVSRVDG